MSIEYDEIRITTRREIDICLAAIGKLEAYLAAMEEKFGTASDVFMQQMITADSIDPEKQHWYESCLALKRWQKRLAEHQQIMQM
jgi:hypothetical protein